MFKRIYIEITNVCDLSCPFCRKNTRPPVFMAPELFSHILQEVRPYSDHIYLHVQGEPLLHPSFRTILQIAEGSGVHVHLVTNGSLLDRYYDLLNSPAIQTIAVSLQSAAARDTSAISDYIDTVLSFAETASTTSDIPVDLRLWRNETETDPNMNACLARIKARYSLVPTKRRNSYRILPHVYVSFENDFEWPKRSDEESGHGTCLGGRMQMGILSSGTVVPCCLDAEGVIALGDLTTESFSEILKKPRFLNLVHGFQEHRLTEPLCRSCTFRRRFG